MNGLVQFVHAAERNANCSVCDWVEGKKDSNQRNCFQQDGGGRL
jgi:hypothetical protein